MRLNIRDIPPRVATGAYILYAGWDMWHGGEEEAQALHGIASTAFPALRKVPPTKFTKAIAAAEIATGAAVLIPVPNKFAGAILTGFAGGLLTFYLRAPSLHKPGSVWPTAEGIGTSKDIWLLGIGLGLLADAFTAS